MLKYQNFTKPCCKNIGISKFKFVAKLNYFGQTGMYCTEDNCTACTMKVYI